MTGSTRNTGQSRLSTPTVVAAFLVLIAFGILVAYLIGQIDQSNEVRWTRLSWIFASVEAIAFGAAGALFGSTIQRQRAENAESAASENASAAANGRALAITLKADDPEVAGGTFEALGADVSPQAVAVAKRHAELAKQLFP
jgi:hypothetical protein